MALHRPKGDNIRINATITDQNGAAVTPSSVNITIKDSASVTQVNAAAMTSTGTTGQYYYNYQTSAASATGTWTVYVDAQVGASTGRQDSSFVLYVV